jgi:hypothetical protein
VPTLKVLAAGAIAGVAANVSGYIITGRLFHRYQTRTPATWRSVESWTQYQYAAALRIGACIGIAFLGSVVWPSLPGGSSLLTGLSFGLILWAVTLLPAVLEIALFVNWHRGFVIGLLLDWLLVCLLAGAAAALASGAV